MEVRCGKCNKLFRVSDDKITGRGIKFTCTRCGESVKITRGEFESSMPAQSAVSSHGMFEPAVSASHGPVPGPEYTTAGTAVSLPSAGEAADMEIAAGQGHKTDELPTPAVPDFLQEREEPPSPEPYPFEEAPPLMEQQPQAEPKVPSKPVQEEIQAEPVKEPAAPFVPEPRDEPVIATETKQEPVPEPRDEPASAAETKQELALELRDEPVPAPETKQETATKPEPELDAKVKPEYAYARKSEPGPTSEQKPAATAITTAETRTAAVPEIQARPVAAVTAASAKGPVRPVGTVPPKAAKETPPPETVRSGRFLMVTLAACLLLGLAGLGAYLYIRSSPPAGKDSGTAMVSIEGLQLINPVGSLDANGDLLVSGVLENTTDRERADWYIAVDVFDTGGKALKTIRMLNGKQIYTKRDYELLAKRGVNVQELKAKALQTRGVVLPPKGKTSFELRYLQPPDGIASFNATLQPFDPARLLKEIEGETR